MESIDNALATVSNIQANLGAAQNRFTAISSTQQAQTNVLPLKVCCQALEQLIAERRNAGLLQNLRLAQVRSAYCTASEAMREFMRPEAAMSLTVALGR